MTPISFFFFIIVPRPGPPADPSRNWSGPVTMDSPRPVLPHFSLSLFLVSIELTKNREPRRAILRLATNRKPSRFKADAFSTFYSAFEPSKQWPDVISRTAFCFAALPRSRLFDHYVAPLCRPLSPRQSKYPIWLADPKITFVSVISPSGVRWHTLTIDLKKLRYFGAISLNLTRNKYVHVLTIKNIDGHIVLNLIIR